MDREIERLFDQKGDQFSVPVRAFVIFEEEEGYQRAL